MSKIKNDGLDQYDAEPFEQQQFGTAGVEGVKVKNKGKQNNHSDTGGERGKTIKILNKKTQQEDQLIIDIHPSTDGSCSSRFSVPLTVLLNTY